MTLPLAAAPFTIGQMFRKTDVPVGLAVAVSDGTAQVTPKNYWPDRSLEFAVIAGVAALTANISQTVTLSVGTANSGTALTTTNLKTTGITAAIAAGAFGTVSSAITD
jgi:hypothetical protein